MPNLHMNQDERKDRPRTRGKLGNNEILNAVRDAVLKAGKCRVADLAAQFNVSAVSIRKSLNMLERQGLIQRFHGEARIYTGDDIPFRMHLHYAEKQLIASRAESLIEAGETILMEAGSAIAMLAERIKKLQSLTVITTNLFIARMFRGSKVRVIVLGGLYQDESESLVGPSICEAIRKIGFTKAFIGVSGFTISDGFMLNDVARAAVTRAILERSRECNAKVWVLTDSSKFGISHAAKIYEDLSLISGVVTDAGIPQDFRDYLESSGVKVLI
jgi:DeoR/GlpR family transcriptional regulator of sugar metabolism